MIIGSHPFLNSKRMYPIVCLLSKPFMFVASAIIYAYCILNEPSVFLIPSIHIVRSPADICGGDIVVIRALA